MAGTTNAPSTGITMLRDIVENYPYIVQALVWLGIIFGIWLIKRGLDFAREKASAGIGIGQSEKELGKKATNNITFGIIFINFMWFTQLIMNTVGIVDIGNDPTDYLHKDIYESAENASDLLMYVVWTINGLGFLWLFRGTYVLHAAIDNPYKYEKWVGIKLYCAAIIALHIKKIMIYASTWIHLDFIAKWLGA